MAVVIRRALARPELDAVFRLRYDVYLQELGRTQRHADHATRRLEEPLDASGSVTAAFDGLRVVGTLRSNYCRDSDLSEYRELYQMARVELSPATTSVTSKLLVASEYRNSSLAYRLAAATYHEGLRAGMEDNFIDVYPERVPFFERLGFRVHIPEVSHPEFGSVVVMHLRVRDADHMSRVNSPLLGWLRRTQVVAA